MENERFNERPVSSRTSQNQLLFFPQRLLPASTLHRYEPNLAPFPDSSRRRRPFPIAAVSSSFFARRSADTPPQKQGEETGRRECGDEKRNKKMRKTSRESKEARERCDGNEKTTFERAYGDSGVPQPPVREPLFVSPCDIG